MLPPQPAPVADEAERQRRLDQMKRRATGLLVPQMNRGVDAALFCFAFLYIATRGSGIWSIDQVLGKKGR